MIWNSVDPGIKKLKIMNYKAPGTKTSLNNFSCIKFTIYHRTSSMSSTSHSTMMVTTAVMATTAATTTTSSTTMVSTCTAFPVPALAVPQPMAALKQTITTTQCLPIMSAVAVPPMETAVSVPAPVFRSSIKHPAYGLPLCFKIQYQDPSLWASSMLHRRQLYEKILQPLASWKLRPPQFRMQIFNFIPTINHTRANCLLISLNSPVVI